jgi:organic hydroperoxide reductase OsmC/OhrA
MMQHLYNLKIVWTGNRGAGTISYMDYDRTHEIIINNKMMIEASSDAAFRGDACKHNPEELFLASISSCHMLWYLHLCAVEGIVITAYTDEATGIMEENETGGRFTDVLLKPRICITDSLHIDKANLLHNKAHEYCFIANSCNFPIRHEAECIYAE